MPHNRKFTHRRRGRPHTGSPCTDIPPARSLVDSVSGPSRLHRFFVFAFVGLGLLLAFPPAVATIWAQDPPATSSDPPSTQPTPIRVTQSPGTAEPAEGPGLFAIIFSGGWVGFLIVAFLFALSMLAAYLVFDQVMTLRRAEIMPDKIGEQVRQLIGQGRVQEADQICRAKPSFLSFVLLNGLAEVEGGWPAVEKAMEDATAEQSARLFRKVEFLSVIGNIAPMVGLLGTVTGMIFAFQRVASTQGAAGAAELAEGIYQALVTTVGGLIVAIPSLGAFAIFRNRVDQMVAEAAYAAQHAFSPLKRLRAPRPASSAGGSAPPAPPRS